jgi:hypothetical protein
MVKYLIFIFSFYLLISCNSSKERNVKIEKISFNRVGKCEDALMDVGNGSYKRDSTYVLSQKVFKDSVNVIFRFIDACCQEFKGTYSVKQDSAYFLYEPSNDIMCSCLCWYKYQLNIKSTNTNFNTLVVKEKRGLFQFNSYNFSFTSHTYSI